VKESVIPYIPYLFPVDKQLVMAFSDL